MEKKTENFGGSFTLKLDWRITLETAIPQSVTLDQKNEINVRKMYDHKQSRILKWLFQK